MEAGEKLDRAAYEGAANVWGVEVDVELVDDRAAPLGFANVPNPANYKRYIGKIDEQDTEWKPKGKLLERAVCSRPVRILAVQAATLSELSLSVTCPPQLRQIALPKTLGRVKPFSTTHLPLVSQLLHATDQAKVWQDKLIGCTLLSLGAQGLEDLNAYRSKRVVD